MAIRKTSVRAFFTITVLMGLGACEAALDPQASGDIALGRAFAETNCGGCHAVAETGESPYPAAPPFRTLSERYPVENLAEALAEGIGVTHSGEVEMPEFVLTPEEIDGLLAYLQSIQD